MRLVRSKIPELDGLPLQEYRRRFYARVRARNRARNLTHNGKRRQRGAWHRYPDLDGLPPALRVRERQRRWRERSSPKALELAWRSLRSEMNIIVPEILPPIQRGEE